MFISLGQTTVAAEIGVGAAAAGKAAASAAGTTSRAVGWWMAGCAGQLTRSRLIIA